VQLTSCDRLLHINASLTQPCDVVMRLLGSTNVDRLLPVIEAIFEERAKHTVLLVDGVEQSADMTLRTEIAPANCTESSFVAIHHLILLLEIGGKSQRRITGGQVGKKEFPCAMGLPGRIAQTEVLPVSSIAQAYQVCN